MLRTILIVIFITKRMLEPQKSLHLQNHPVDPPWRDKDCFIIKHIIVILLTLVWTRDHFTPRSASTRTTALPICIGVPVWIDVQQRKNVKTLCMKRSPITPVLKWELNWIPSRQTIRPLIVAQK